MTPDEELRRTRLHEAGHAVVGRAVGRDADGVTVFGGHGHTRHLLPSDRQVGGMTHPEWRAFLESLAVSNLAGEAALEVFGDSDPEGGADPDGARALKVARSLDPAAPEVTLARLRGRAVDLARKHRAAIERFAATLAANGDRLAGSEVDAALRAAFGGWPMPRFDPASEAAVVCRRRDLFEASMAALGPGETTFRTRLDLWRQADDAARSGTPLRPAARPVEPKAGLGWTPEQRRAAQAAYLRGGTPEALAHVAGLRAKQ